MNKIAEKHWDVALGFHTSTFTSITARLKALISVLHEKSEK